MTTTTTIAAPSARQFCSFSLGRSLFGIEVNAVTEIVSRFQFTKVPQASVCIAGMMNHRGDIATLVLLGTAIGVESAPRGSEKNMVIFVQNKSLQNKSSQSQGELVGLVVDQIGEIIEVGEDETETLPESINPQLRGLLRFACRRRGKLLLALDLDAVFRLPELDPATPADISSRSISHELVS